MGMECYVIKGGNPLAGEVEIAGAKNAALPIISAAIMSDESVTLENLPDVNDINVLLDAVAGIGAHVERFSSCHHIHLLLFKLRFKFLYKQYIWWDTISQHKIKLWFKNINPMNRAEISAILLQGQEGIG